jgi:hypothetical protein
VGTTEHTEYTEAGSVGTTEHTEYTEARDNRLRVVFRGRVEGVGTFRTLQKHRENMQKFGSCPLRSKTLVFPGFLAFRRSSFGFPAYPCMSMPAGAGSSCALPWTLVSRPVSRQSRPRTLVFLGKTCGFVAEVQDSN